MFNEHIYNRQLWPHYTILRIKQSLTQYNEIDQMFSIWFMPQKHFTHVLVCFCAGYQLQNWQNHQYLFATTLHRFKQSVNSIKLKAIDRWAAPILIPKPLSMFYCANYQFHLQLQGIHNKSTLYKTTSSLRNTYPETRRTKHPSDNLPCLCNRDLWCSTLYDSCVDECNSAKNTFIFIIL